MLNKNAYCLKASDHRPLDLLLRTIRIKSNLALMERNCRNQMNLNRKTLSIVSLSNTPSKTWSSHKQISSHQWSNLHKSSKNSRKVRRRGNHGELLQLTRSFANKRDRSWNTNSHLRAAEKSTKFLGLFGLILQSKKRKNTPWKLRMISKLLL